MTLCLLELSKKLHVKDVTIMVAFTLAEEENTKRHANMEMGKLISLQAESNRNSESCRNSLPERTVHHMVTQYQVYIPENTQTA